MATTTWRPRGFYDKQLLVPVTRPHPRPFQETRYYLPYQPFKEISGGIRFQVKAGNAKTVTVLLNTSIVTNYITSARNIRAKAFL